MAILIQTVDVVGRQGSTVSFNGFVDGKACTIVLIQSVCRTSPNIPFTINQGADNVSMG